MNRKTLVLGLICISVLSFLSLVSGTEPMEFSGFCSEGLQGGNLRIMGVSVDNGGEGDDNEWKLLDVLEVEIDVANVGVEDLDDIIVELGLFDIQGNNRIVDLEFENVDGEKSEIGDLDEDDEETATFRFRVPADITDGDYKLAIKAFSNYLGEDLECTDFSDELSNNFFKSIKIKREENEGRFIVFDNENFEPTEAMCGQSVRLTADVFNVGYEDQDQVKVILKNDELQLNQFIEIKEDMLKGNKEKVTFDFTIPKNVTSKIYFLLLDAQYDYRNGNYRESLNEQIRVPLKVTCPTKSFSLTKTQELNSSHKGMFKVENTGEKTIENITFSTEEVNTIFSPNLIEFLASGESQNVEISVSDLKFGANSIKVNVKDKSGELQKNLTFSLKETFCKKGEKGDLVIRSIEIQNGDNEEWKLLDEIEVELEVENNGHEKIEEVIVEIGLFDSKGKDKVSSLEFDSPDEEQIEIGDLDEDDSETALFKFKVPADFKDGSYKLTAKSYSNDLGEDEACVDSSDDLSDDIFEDIDIERESDESKFIAFNNIVLEPNEAICRESIRLTADIFNIGDENQDKVNVNLISKELGINEFIMLNNFDEGDDGNINFEFIVPEKEKGSYQLTLSADYDYKNGEYRESSENAKIIPIEIIGCSNEEVINQQIPSKDNNEVIHLKSSKSKKVEEGRFFSRLFNSFKEIFS